MITEAAQGVLDAIAEGKSLRQIERAGGPKLSTFLTWAAHDKELADQYARAMEIRSERLADELVEIADDGTNDFMRTDAGLAYNAEHVQRSKLRVDTRKWLLAKLQPKKYGEKIEQTHVGDPNKPIVMLTNSDAGLV